MNVIIKPIITEKSTANAQRKVYMFEVDIDSSKHQVRHALESMYSVKVKEIKSSIRKGKVKRVGKRMKPNKQSNRKIMNITLREGTLDIFPQS